MIARRIKGATHNLGPPQGVDPEECGHLWIKHYRDGPQPVCESAWEPTPRELETLQAGGSVILRILGWQPAVAIYVEPASAEDDKPAEPA